MKVERYGMSGFGGGMVLMADGPYVAAEDFDRVETERDALQALLNERDEKLARYAEFLAWCENADTAAGYCVCGDSIEAHNSVTSDHGAVDEWDHSLGNWAKELRK